METLSFKGREIRAKCPSIEEFTLSSLSCPPSQRVVDSTKLTITNSKTKSITDCMNCLSPASSGEDIKVEYVMDSSDYTGVEPRSSLNRCEDIEERRERNTGCMMSREQKDILTNMKEEEEDWERQSVKIEREGFNEERLCKEEVKERDEQTGGYITDQVAQTDKLVKYGVKSEHGQQEGEELSSLVTSCLQKLPRVLIRRLEFANGSVPVSSPLSSQLERPLKLLPSSLENGIGAEASLISTVTSPRNQNTGQTVEMSSQVFACSQCPFVQTEKVNLHQHMDKVYHEDCHRSLRSQQSPSSDQHPTPPKTLPTPTQSHPNTPGAHTCTQCGKSFVSKSQLSKHKKIHKIEPQYRCSQCGKSFTQLGNLKQHQRIHTGERPYHCSQCGKGFSRSDNLKLHQRTHTGERPCYCSQCGKSFSRSDKLKLHQRTHTGERPYYCSQCGKSFSRLGTLQEHQFTHTGQWPYHSSQSGKNFTQSNVLKQHQQTHTGEHPYHCSQCGMSFTHSSVLKIHERTHTGERPYHCSQCGKSFAQSGTWKQHQRTHTGERPYHCSQCGKSFAQSSVFTQHQRTHTGERPYHCSLCGKSFSRSDKLKLHQRTHTGECLHHCF